MLRTVGCSFCRVPSPKPRRRPVTTKAYAAMSADRPTLQPYDFERRALRPNDVAIAISHCGVCHSDLHMARNDWNWTTYPCVPGHEIVGHVTAVGVEVSDFQPGDRVAVGCMVDSCMDCDRCHAHEEQLCRKGMTLTYSGIDRVDGSLTQGGYSTDVVVRRDFVLRLPETLDIARAAPLLCAGITTYSPLRTWNVGPGSRVGVIGLGGLGHMAVKFAVAMGADVTVISRSPGKTQDALNLGAQHVLISTDEAAMAAAASSFDLIVDTVPSKHDLAPYIDLLDIDATLVIVGLIGQLDTVSTLPMVMGRRRISGSPIGGIAQTQEMIDFAAEHGILPETETIAMQDIEAAFARMEKGDVRYRFVIDMASLKDAA